MKLNEVLDIAIMYLDLSDELKVVGTNRTPVTNKKLRLLLRCANVIYGEIASDYIRLRHKESLEVIDNKIMYQAFEKRVIDIENVYKNDSIVSYNIYPNYIEVNEIGSVEIIYNYLPQDLSLDDDIAYGTCLAPTTFAAGIAGEYSLVNNMYDEAIAYERKFKEGIVANQYKKKSQYIKSRRWY